MDLAVALGYRSGEYWKCTFLDFYFFATPCLCSCCNNLIEFYSLCSCKKIPVLKALIHLNVPAQNERFPSWFRKPGPYWEYVTGVDLHLRALTAVCRADATMIEAWGTKLLPNSVQGIRVAQDNTNRACSPPVPFTPVWLVWCDVVCKTFCACHTSSSSSSSSSSWEQTVIVWGWVN